MNRTKIGSLFTGVLVLASVLGAALLFAGCGIGVGPTQQLNIDEPLGSAAVTDVNLAMGAGKLTVQPGASGLVSGVVRYNVEKWKPVITRGGSSLTIRQGTTKGLAGIGSNIVNEWDLKLGTAPMRLAVTAGAYQGTYELGGLSLERLSIKDGAAKSQVSFSSPNPSQMESLTYETGASSVTLAGLGNANFRRLDFRGGAGSFILDFSGPVRTNGSVNISAGVGTVRIVVPAQTAAKLTVKGKLSNVSKEGAWVAAGSTYSTPGAGAGQQGKLLTITVNMDLGNLTLATE